MIFEKIVPDECFSLAGNLISWHSTVGVIRTPTANTFFSCACCQRACHQPVVTVAQVVTATL